MKLFLLTLAFALAATVTVSAQSQQVRVRGTVVAVDGTTLTVSVPTGPLKVTLAPDLAVKYLVKSDFSQVTPGSWVGCAATVLPDGTMRAIEIHIFPPGLTPGAGSRAYDLGPSSTMTNGSAGDIDAQVGSVGAHTLSITYPDGKKTIVVPPSAVIVKYAPADRSALAPGAHVIFFAARADDGSLSTASINVGKDGLVPPM
jgi:hypothetical protein